MDSSNGAEQTRHAFTTAAAATATTNGDKSILATAAAATATNDTDTGYSSSTRSNSESSSVASLVSTNDCDLDNLTKLIAKIETSFKCNALKLRRDIQTLKLIHEEVDKMKNHLRDKIDAFDRMLQ